MSKDRSFASAIHILAALAYRAPDLVSSEELALGLQTNPGLVRRLMSRLSSAGLIKTTKGKNGGSTLNKPLEEITISAVYEAVKDPPLFATFDKEPFAGCEVSCNMGEVLTGLFGELEAGLVNSMQKVTLRDVVNQVKQKA